MGDFNSSLPVKTVTAGDVSISAASGGIALGAIASGAVASGAFASGAIASGAYASGAFASGSIAAGAIAAGAIAAGATSIAENEDVASADADRGIKNLAVRKATPANTSGTDGDYEFLQMSAGRLWASVNVDSINGVSPPLMGAGNTGTGSLRVTIASDQVAIPVTFGQAVATGEVNDYDTSVNITATSTDNHDYTVTAAKTLLLKQVTVAASGKMKITMTYDPAGTPVTLGVFFTSTANPTYAFTFPQPFEAAATKVIRVARTNLDSSTMDVYSTINGIEV